MALRPDVVNNLREQAQQKGIRLRRHGGERARYNMYKAYKGYEDAQRKFLEHEYATHYRIWVMGGARYGADSEEAQFTKQLSQALTLSLQNDLVTGAGPGIMGAAVEGFLDVKERTQEKGQEFTARNVGIGIKVPWEEDRSTFDYYVEHIELPPRVQELMLLSHGAYVGAGALGTAYEAWTLIQLRQMHHLEDGYTLVFHPSWRESLEEYKKQWYEERIQRGEKPAMGEKDLNIIYSNHIDEIVGIFKVGHEKWQEEIGKHVQRRTWRGWRPSKKN